MITLLWLFFGAEDASRQTEIVSARENYFTSLYCIALWRFTTV